MQGTLSLQAWFCSPSLAPNVASTLFLNLEDVSVSKVEDKVEDFLQGVMWAG